MQHIFYLYVYNIAILYYTMLSIMRLTVLNIKLVWNKYGILWLIYIIFGFQFVKNVFCSGMCIEDDLKYTKNILFWLNVDKISFLL